MAVMFAREEQVTAFGRTFDRDAVGGNERAVEADMAVTCGSGGVDRVVEGGCACGEDFQAFPEVGVGGGLGQGVGGGELLDASAVDEEPQRVDGVGPWGEAAGAFTGADGAAMSCEFAGEPLCGGPVDGQDIGIGDNGRHGTPWVRLGDVSTFSIYQGVSLYAKASRSRSASITLPGIPH